MDRTDGIQPRIEVLTEAQKAYVHETAQRILFTVGVRVDSPQARDIFSRTGCRLSDGERVHIPAELINRALETAPAVVEIYDRRGERRFRLGHDRTRFGIGVTSLYYQEPASGAVIPFSRQHMAAISRLGEHLASFDLVCTPGIVQDVSPHLQDLYGTLDMVANTVKPLGILVSDEERFVDVLDLLQYLHGDLAAQPFVIPYFNPITPLVMNQGTVDKMLVTIQRGLPFMYSNYGMAGATTPVTPAATLTLLNAELLAGLVFSQLVQEGAPIILGNLPAFFDMQGLGSFYDAQSYVINLACAEMMALYGLPHCGTSGSGMGWTADLIAAGHQWINHLTSCMGKIGLAPFVGDNLNSKAFSPTLVVLANEIIAQARRLAAGFNVEDATEVLQELEEVGPGGNFLTSKRTLQRFRTAYYRSEIWPNLTMEEWQAQNSPQAEALLREYTLDRMAQATPPEDQAALMAKGRVFIDHLT